MNTLSLRPEGSLVAGSDVFVPIERMHEHPVLRCAAIDAGKLRWPGMNSRSVYVEKLRLVERHGKQYVSVPASFNFDFFVDETTALLVSYDRQRYYTRYSDTQWLPIGTFTAITVNGMRRYFVWGTSGWLEIDLARFVYFRDHDETHFGQSRPSDIAQTAPRALEAQPDVEALEEEKR